MTKQVLRWIGIVLVAASLVGAIAGLFGMTLSARAVRPDTLIGAFAYGATAGALLMIALLGSFLGSLIWGIGIVGRANVSRIERIESLAQRVFLYVPPLLVGVALARG